MKKLLSILLLVPALSSSLISTVSCGFIIDDNETQESNPLYDTVDLANMDVSDFKFQGGVNTLDDIYKKFDERLVEYFETLKIIDDLPTLVFDITLKSNTTPGYVFDSKMLFSNIQFYFEATKNNRKVKGKTKSFITDYSHLYNEKGKPTHLTTGTTVDEAEELLALWYRPIKYTDIKSFLKNDVYFEYDAKYLVDGHFIKGAKIDMKSKATSQLVNGNVYNIDFSVLNINKFAQSVLQNTKRPQFPFSRNDLNKWVIDAFDNYKQYNFLKNDVDFIIKYNLDPNNNQNSQNNIGDNDKAYYESIDLIAKEESKYITGSFNYKFY
ncbi:hypothetical protein SCORR_v1c06450 [Spiroplasma corruscae]|uniref:Lipoprotein n=1 Tax=Spiroplasma corruscae TaxID=216934 RepID=A0A222EPH7_9MOLU|nr:hypothetical protein [Spiroplasma corruscae]ASP28417.1 hypothetical protein SCORR_v1c06450 [Spiroplasma corruscae]